MTPKHIEEKIRHQIEIEFDSNKGRFSETFIEAIADMISEAYQAGQDSVRINNACSNPLCPTIAQRIAPEMCPCRIAAQDELSDILSNISQLQDKNKEE